jgi:hypothetical protein
MDDVVGSSSSSNVVWGFARRHTCGSVCEHPHLKLRADLSGIEEKNGRCASAHILHAAAAFGEVKRNPESDLVLWALIHPAVVHGKTGSECLDSATGRALGTTADRIEGSWKRSLLVAAGGGQQRARRVDAFDKELVYNYIHGIETPTPSNNVCVDFCPLVEIDKGKRDEWKGKHWDSPWGPVKLTCKPHLRRGSLFEISETFLNSETYRK